jgi:hypothetical protein
MMPIDSKKREKEVMKKRRKAKEAARKRQKSGFLNRLGILSPHTWVRQARKFPIKECLISRGWQTGNEGLIQVAIARQQPDGLIAFGVYLVDVYCLGLKNTFCNANISAAEYQRDVIGHVSQTTPMERCNPELAHQMVYQGIEYAAQFGFRPQRDFKWSQYILAPRGELPEPYKLTFGKDGKPLFISGPYDNAQAILARLERNPGPGNYDYVIMAGGFEEDDEELF